MNTGTWRLQRLRNHQLIHFLESGVILIKDSDSGFESKLNPIKSLIPLDFKFWIPKVNLYLNLKYTETPLPRFNSAPPHLWKGVRIDIEGRWLESAKHKEPTTRHLFGWEIFDRVLT